MITFDKPVQEIKDAFYKTDFPGLKKQLSYLEIM